MKPGSRASARPDDRARHDHRHGAHGAWDLAKAASKMRRLGRAVIGGLLCATVATLFLSRPCSDFSMAAASRLAAISSPPERAPVHA